MPRVILCLLIIGTFQTIALGKDMLQFDNTWPALVSPGVGEIYFDIESMPKMETKTKEFSIANAWRLAEVSRISYKMGAGPYRNYYLKKAKLKEIHFLETKGLFYHVIVSQDKENPFTIVAFRGSQDIQNWITNFDAILIDHEKSGKVHKGFNEAIDLILEDIENNIKGLEAPLFICGHSLGGALAIVTASRLSVQPQAAYIYGCPRVGNGDFAKSLNNLTIFRIENHLDMVTNVPPEDKPFNYKHVGKTIYITHDNKLLIDPDELKILDDRLTTERNYDDKIDSWQLFDPPEPFSDHAPVNYVCHLQRELINSMKNK